MDNKEKEIPQSINDFFADCDDFISKLRSNNKKKIELAEKMLKENKKQLDQSINLITKKF